MVINTKRMTGPAFYKSHEKFRKTVLLNVVYLKRNEKRPQRKKKYFCTVLLIKLYDLKKKKKKSFYWLLKTEEREGEGEGVWEKHQCEKRNIDQLLLAHLLLGVEPEKPMHLPWPGIQVKTFWLTGQCPTNWTTPARANLMMFIPLKSTGLFYLLASRWNCRKYLPRKQFQKCFLLSSLVLFGNFDSYQSIKYLTISVSTKVQQEVQMFRKWQLKVCDLTETEF